MSTFNYLFIIFLRYSAPDWRKKWYFNGCCRPPFTWPHLLWW